MHVNMEGMKLKIVILVGFLSSCSGLGLKSSLTVDKSSKQKTMDISKNSHPHKKVSTLRGGSRDQSDDHSRGNSSKNGNSSKASNLGKSQSRQAGKRLNLAKNSRSRARNNMTSVTPIENPDKVTKNKMTQSKLNQGKVTKNKMTQNKLNQGKVIENKVTENPVTEIGSRSLSSHKVNEESLRVLSAPQNKKISVVVPKISAEKSLSYKNFYEEQKVSLQKLQTFYDEMATDQFIKTYTDIKKQPHLDVSIASQAHYLAGLFFYATKAYGASIQSFDSMLKLRGIQDSDRTKGLFAKAKTFKKMNIPEQSEVLFQALIKEYPASVEASRATVELKKMGRHF
jgi:hypothetical protein